MQNAEKVLGIIRERGIKDLPLGQMYRQMYNLSLYLQAYSKIGKNKGALTPGINEDTVDGMSMDKINAIINALRYERYRFKPVRRIYIQKKNSTKKRPLGLPTWSDKLVQEVIRMMLEAYYEPRFSNSSHGFRPGRGCHTALKTIEKTWTGTIWFIEGDIKGYFDNINHDVLMNILKEKIDDYRFIRMVEELLKSGYMEEWTYNQTYSGTPQGGILSPLLANIYLDKLDKYVEETLIPRFTRGKVKANNPEYASLNASRRHYRKTGNTEKEKKYKGMLKGMPSKDTHDPNYRRLRYIRYADDFILGFSGPKTEAEEIKAQIANFLGEELKLNLSEEKTLITHAKSEKARFLSYNLQIAQCENVKKANGSIRLLIPNGVITSHIGRYQEKGKTKHLNMLVNDSDYSIINHYQARYRGVANYYQLAHNRSQKMGKLKMVMEHSLVMTLASKHKTCVSKIYQKYATKIYKGNGKTYKGLEVIIERKGKEPLVATWGGISLERTDKKVVINDTIALPNIGRSELVERLLKEKCEICDATENLSVHHIRALKDLKGKTPFEWMMAARKRKTITVCHECHVAIHQGKLQNHNPKS